MTFKIGDRVVILDPRSPSGSNSTLGFSDELLSELVGKNVEVSHMGGSIPESHFYFKTSLMIGINPPNEVTVYWPKCDAVIYPPPKAGPDNDPYAGYHKTPDGFWTNPVNWDKWLI